MFAWIKRAVIAVGKSLLGIGHGVNFEVEMVDGQPCYKAVYKTEF